MTEYKVDVIYNQEMHVSSEADLLKHGRVSAYHIAEATYVDVYRTVTYVRNGIQDVK